MQPESILGPMGALAALTFVVLTLIPFVRFRAAFAGRVKREDFALGESARVPADVSLPNRNYMNLLELPLLFYVLCVVVLVTRRIDPALVMMAWIYVGLRAIHSAIHILYNNVFHRLTAFAASNVVLALMWVHFYFRLLPATH
jgi:hypothetical protein